jgi:hypothetical protein
MSRSQCKKCKKNRQRIININEDDNNNNNLKISQDEKYENIEGQQKSHQEILINEDSDETISETEIELIANNKN